MIVKIFSSQIHHCTTVGFEQPRESRSRITLFYDLTQAFIPGNMRTLPSISQVSY